MREIKFRAWNRFLGVMVDPFITLDQRGIVDRGFGRDGTEDSYLVMQYTGLKDKNGVEIYESDILEFDDYYFEGIGNGGTVYAEWRRKRREVRFENGMFTVGQDHALAMIIRDAREEDDRYDFEDREVTGCEVIGNIYENPELLKRGDDE